jgi:hypothetical protein
MADNSQEAQRQVEAKVKIEVRKLAEGSNRYDLARAAELQKALEDMTQYLLEAQAAADKINLKSPEDAGRARETFKRELSEALVALRDALQGHEKDAFFLVGKTRDELKALRALAEKGPEMKPRLLGLLGSVPKIDEWIAQADRDPQGALKEIIGGARTTINEIQTDVPAEGARREGVMVATDAVRQYVSGGFTEEQMRRQGLSP